MRVKACGMSVLCAGLCVALLGLAAGALGEETTISGIVYGDESNEYGDITSVVVVVEQETDVDYYTVDMDTKAQELLNELGNIVEVQGTVEKRADGTKLLHVSSWTPKK